jgi:hypothetical protein
MRQTHLCTPSKNVASQKYGLMEIEYRPLSLAKELCWRSSNLQYTHRLAKI